jgi:hypothetical protein
MTRVPIVVLVFAVITATIAGILLEQVVVGSNRKPEIRTVIQSPNHVAASMEQPVKPGVVTAADFNRYAATVCPKAGLRTYQDGEVILHTELLACLVSAARDNREEHPTAVTPQPYALHPGKTPLIDPTQDAYYRSLLRDGRFPTTGSDPGRPE